MPASDQAFETECIHGRSADVHQDPPPRGARGVVRGFPLRCGGGANTGWKTAVTLTATGVTANAGIEGARLGKNSPAPARGATEPCANTPGDVARAQRRSKVLQWSIAVSTGALLVMTAQQGEQQEPSQIVAGILQNARS